MLIIGGSDQKKTNSLFYLVKKQDNDELTDKIYLHAKDVN